MLGRDDPISVTSSLPKRPRLNQIAAAAYAPVKAAEFEKKTRVEKDEYQKIRVRNAAGAALVHDSGLGEMFPGVEWNTEDYPHHFYDSNHTPTEVVVYDAWDESKRKDRVFLLLKRDPSGHVNIYSTTMMRNDDGWSHYWSQGALITCAADLGRVLDQRTKS